MKKKSILLVSNYYPPERGAAPNRIEVLAEALQTSGYEVQVVCPLPNYPTGNVFPAFRKKLYSKTHEDGILVHRVWLWPSNSSNKFIRLFSMLSFAMSLALFFVLKRTPKLIFVQYSPVFVGFTAVCWSRILGKKTILNVSDLWPLAGREMGLLQPGFYYSLLEKMESLCYRKSDLIVGQSEEILQHIKSKNGNTKLFLYRNFPNFTPPEVPASTSQLPIKIVYAGLLGIAQGISTLASNITIPEQVEFHVYGDGPDTQRIIEARNLRVIYHGAVSRRKLHQEIVQYDVALIPLAQRIYGSVPSKIFEFTRLGLPVVYMAGGEGEDLVNSHQLGWVLPVQDIVGLQQFLQHISHKILQQFPRRKVQQRAIDAFNFKEQFISFEAQLKKL